MIFGLGSGWPLQLEPLFRANILEFSIGRGLGALKGSCFWSGWDLVPGIAGRPAGVSGYRRAWYRSIS